MEIREYFDEIKEVIDQYSATRFVLDAIVEFDIRPGEQGYLKGAIYFADNSVLHFKEFIDTIEEIVDKLMYVYHYQYLESQLIFRYDNARHKPELAFIEHQHLPQQIIEFSAPSLSDVLEEIFTSKGWI